MLLRMDMRKSEQAKVVAKTGRVSEASLGIGKVFVRLRELLATFGDTQGVEPETLRIKRGTLVIIERTSQSHCKNNGADSVHTEHAGDNLFQIADGIGEIEVRRVGETQQLRADARVALDNLCHLRRVDELIAELRQDFLGGRRQGRQRSDRLHDEGCRIGHFSIWSH